MEANLQGGDVSAMHVKTEAAEESSSAPLVGSRESPAPCGDGACRGGGLQQTAEEVTEELQAATAAPRVLLYPVSSDRFFTTSADGKTYLKIAPAAVLPPAPAEKTLSSGSDFSSKAVLCLIEAVGRRWGLYETRERSQLFQSVQEEMASKGHILPVEKIRRKWNNLIVTYKRVKDRSRETGHAKTSWEFFDLMDATLCDTIGTQIINNKRNKGGTNASAQPGPSTKITSKPGQLPPPTTVVHPTGDFSTTGGAEPATSQVINSTAASTSQSAATISAVKAPELKPLIVLNGDVASSQPATVVPASTFISSPCFTETTSTSSLVSTSSTDLNVPSYKSRKTSSFTSGLIPFCLSTASLGHSPNVLGLSSLPPTSSCHTPSIATSLSPSVLPGIEEQGQKGNKEQTSVTLFQEILKRQEEQAYLDRVTRRRVEAREKRRERREVRMSESLGRIATALELLSSKQDTVIALLQRLADRK